MYHHETAAFHAAVEPIDGKDPLTDGQESNDIKRLSHGVAIILLFSESIFDYL